MGETKEYRPLQRLSLGCMWIVGILLFTLSAPSLAHYNNELFNTTPEQRTGMKLDPDALFVLSLVCIRDSYCYRDLPKDWATVVRDKYEPQLKTDADFEQALHEVALSLDDANMQVRKDNAKVSILLRSLMGALLYHRRNGELVVVTTIRTMPAQMAGLKSGDVIVAINGTPTPRTFDECLNVISDKSGKSVQIKFRRGGDIFQTTLTYADRFPPYEVICKLIGNIAYLRPALSEDDSPSWQRLKEALTALPSSGAKGLILDLRDLSAGGIGPSGDETISGLFVPKGSLRYLTKTAQDTQTWKTKQEPLPVSLPMVVLINGGTYGSAEVSADGLKFHGRAELVGEKTFGETGNLQTTPLDRDHFLVFPFFQRFTLDGTSEATLPGVVVAEKDCAADEGPWYANNKPGVAPSPDLMNKSGQIADKQLRVAISTLQQKISK